MVEAVVVWVAAATTLQVQAASVAVDLVVVSAVVVVHLEAAARQAAGNHGILN
jgi:type III secretory pathway component EscS